MNTAFRFEWRRAFLPIVLAALVCTPFLSACDDDDDDFDHPPPPGQGSMIIDNHTDDDISVFINGLEVEETKDDKWRAYDLEPGVYRVVLEQQGGDHSFRGDIDILEGRQTILEVRFGGPEFTRYDVFVRFD